MTHAHPLPWNAQPVHKTGDCNIGPCPERLHSGCTARSYCAGGVHEKRDWLLSVPCATGSSTPCLIWKGTAGFGRHILSDWYDHEAVTGACLAVYNARGSVSTCLTMAMHAGLKPPLSQNGLKTIESFAFVFLNVTTILFDLSVHEWNHAALTEASARRMTLENLFTELLVLL